MAETPFANLPAWAAWIAQDADGAWWAYEVEPNQQDTGWYENEVGRIVPLGKTSLLVFQFLMICLNASENSKTASLV